MLLKICDFISNLCLVLLIIFIGLHFLNNIFDWHLKFQFRSIQVGILGVFLMLYLLSYLLEKREE